MRTSAGFFDTGLSGKIRIQIRPPRLMWRVIARRAASIWRAVRRPRVVALSPYSPNDTLAPTVASPLLRPFCSLRYFLLAGCSILHSCAARPLRRFGGRGRRGRRLGVVRQYLALHRAAQHDPLLELLGDRLRDQLRVDLGLADLLDVEADVPAHHAAQVGTQRLDVLALLADHDAGARAVDRDARVLRRALDRDARDRRVRELPLQVLADPDVLAERRLEVLGVRVPARRPVAGHRQAEAGRMDFLSHGIPYFALPSPTARWMWQLCFEIVLPRPLARALMRFRTSPLST